MGTYDVMQVCLNGHKITGTYRSQGESARQRCPECGEPTIISCPECDATIPGRYRTPGIVDLTSGPDPDAYCHECGQPYPWTQRKMEAAEELIELADIDDTEKHDLREEIPNLINDTPRSKVAAFKLKEFLERAGNIMSKEARDLLVDIASETAKKVLLPEEQV